MRWFANMKLGTKLIAAFVIVALIAGAIGVVGSYNVDKINDMETVLYDKNMKKVAYMGRWLEDFHDIRAIVRDIYISDDRGAQAEMVEQIKERQQTMDGYLADVEARVQTEEGRRMLEELRSHLSEYRESVKAATELSMAGRKEEAKAVIYGPLLEGASNLDAAGVALLEQQMNLAAQMDVEFTETAKNATTLMIVLAVAGMALAVALGILIARSISRPIKMLADASEKLASGDLNVTIAIDSKDEVGQLATSFAAMTDNMNEVLQNIANASEQVASGSRQVSEASQSLSQGSTEQASSVEQLTASMEQISSQTKQNAERAEQANQLALAASTDAAQGNNQMQGMLTAMEEINESSGNISKIIKVIDEIAFQTNILALNAAVEAARAGQHGKGFAVVAEEVRNLAARSANAAKETTVLIEGSIKKVEAGTRIANETAKALDQIVNGVNKAAELVGSIANASNEQAIGIAQVNQGIAQVSSVIQANSATSEECAAASEELSGQSEHLKDMVGRFRLRRNAANFRQHDGRGAELAARTRAAAYAEAAPGKPRIQLDDNDFGKYA